MSVFQVTHGDSTNQGDHLSVAPVKTGGDNVNQGDTSSAALQPNNQTTINPDGSPINPNSGDEPMVVLDGPLGRAYTQALNLVMANESTGMMAAIAQGVARRREEKPSRGTYVYAMDMSELDGSDALNEAWEWMRKFGMVDGARPETKRPTIIIALESHDSYVSRKAGLVEELARGIGAEVVYSRDATFRALSKSFKK